MRKAFPIEDISIKESVGRGQEKRKEVVVFGSSQGLLAFYCSALLPGSTVKGYEVLPLLYQFANNCAERFRSSKHDINY